MMMSVMVRVVVMSSDVHNSVAEFLYANRPGPVKCGGVCQSLVFSDCLLVTGVIGFAL